MEYFTEVHWFTYVKFDFHIRILLGNEIHFCLKCAVNKQNCRIRRVLIIVKYMFRHPFIYKKKNPGRNITVNDDRYNAMITDFFGQQDVATCRIASDTGDLFKETFNNQRV